MLVEVQCDKFIKNGIINDVIKLIIVSLIR